ncbi:MAG: efflux RND transporter permease subunit [Chlorobi bacterium]|nr:efflux RND transporter permease subunit [Chlorobiota bacterium]
MKKIFKEFGLTNWALKNYNTVKVIMLILIIGGMYAYIDMPRESFPDVAAPEVFVSTPYPGNSAEDIENLITHPLELEFKKIKGVDEIKSTSKSGFSSIDIKFKFDKDPDEALADVKDKIDEVTGDKDWPSDVPTDPMAMKLDFSEMKPIMNVNISGNYSPDRLEDFAEKLQDEIEQLPQISAADIRGVQDKEVEVAVDLNEMLSRNISFHNIENAIKNNNLSVSAGEIREGDIRRNIRVNGDFKNLDEIRNIIIRKAKDKVTYLKDVAKVRFRPKEAESYARQFGDPVVMLDIKKQSGANQLEAADEIEKIIERAKRTYLPKDVQVTITNDLSDKTRQQVSDLENSIIMGMLFVILVLMFFMGFRNSLFVGLAIPLSMLMSFLILHLFGITLNTMVLFGLVLALGMLVDNGIVIVENIYRYREEGFGPLESAKYAVGEVAWPIIASTATTLVAFIPLAFWPGMIGNFMQYLPITLITVLSSSLFVALVINPVLASLYMRMEGKEMSNAAFFKKIALYGFLAVVFFVLRFTVGRHKPSLAGLFNALGLWFVMVVIWKLLYRYVLEDAIRSFQEKFLPWLERAYVNTIRFATRGKNDYLIFFSTVALLILSFILLKMFPLKTSFFPDTEPNQLYVYIEFPISTDIEKVNEFTKEVTEKVRKYFHDHHYDYLVESIVEQVGEGTADPRKSFVGGKTPNKAKIMVDFVEFDKRRGVSTSAIMNDLRKLIRGYAGIKVSVDKDQHKPPMGMPIEMKLTGDDYDKLLGEAVKIKKYIDNAHIPGIEDLQIDVDKNKPELEIEVDKEKAGALGVSTGQVGMQLRTAVYGKEMDSYKWGDDDYPINVRLDSLYRYDRNRLMDQRIVYRDQQTGKMVSVPVSAVAEMKSKATFSAIKRKDLKRVITLSSNVLEGYNANEIVQEIGHLMDAYTMPPDIRYSFEGEQKEMKKNMSFLSKALLMAVLMIFLILVTQFNSLSTPVIIMITVLLSMIGVLMGLILTRSDFIVVMTMIGIISLAGIVVNNAIVLIDYTLLTIKRKKLEAGLPEDAKPDVRMVREAIVEAGRTRLRPVLLTAITTVLGLIPLAIGLNVDFIGLFTHFEPNFYLGGENVAYWGPLAWAVIYGLSFATFLTLVVVPSMFYIYMKNTGQTVKKEK